MEQSKIALAETDMQFLHPVMPGEEVRVRGEKLYFRFNKLKAAVYLYREDGVLACKGEIAGMFKPGAS
jgi:3-hydroxyacyl-[acyl-carrier-protein] dehydratase